MKSFFLNSVTENYEEEEFLFGDINNNDEARIMFWSYQGHVLQEDIYSFIHDSSLVHLRNKKGEKYTWTVRIIEYFN